MDTVELTLPKSNKKVVIRNFTTHRDDDIAEAALLANVLRDPLDETKLIYPIINYNNYKKSYIYSLVESVDGDSSDVKTALDDLRTPDYNAVAAKVEEIIESNSPKVEVESTDSEQVKSAN